MVRGRFLLPIFLCAFLGVAQHSIAGGSAYSLFGIGELSLGQNSRSLGMGSLSSSIWSTNSLLPQNPASWSSIKTAQLQGSFGYENIASSSATDNAFYGTSGIRGASIALPLSPQNGMTLAFGFVPISSVEYSYNFGIQPLQDSISYVGNYSGTGGVSSFFIGSSVVPVSWLSLGASLEYNFGAITRTADILFNETSGYNHTLISTRISPDGFDGRVAAMATFGGFTGGVTVRLPANIRIIEKQEWAPTTYGAKDTIPSFEYRQDLPLAVNGGASFRIAEFLFGMEYGIENWGTAIVNGVHPAELQSSSTIGFGVERTGAATGEWIDRSAFRFGGLYRTSYITLGGNSINEAYFTVGMGFPVNLQSHIDLALQYGSRGTTAGGLMRENIFRLNMSFSINELWFQTRE